MKRMLTHAYLLLLFIPLTLPAQIHDRHIAGTVEKYFARNRTAPAIISSEVVDDFLYGRTLKIRIRGNRNSENEDLGFAFGAAAAVANQATTPLDMLWVEMDVRYKAIETTVAVAPADCSVEAIVKKTKTFGDWWENCLEFL